MSRFSKTEAEKLGWRFVHNQDEARTLRPRDSQGREQTLPPSYVAEKTQETAVGGETLIHEEAETMGLLLERINAYEAHLGRLEDTSKPPEGDASYAEPYGDIAVLKFNENAKTDEENPQDNETNLQAQDEPHKLTVSTPKGDFTEHEFFGRKTDEAVAAHEDFLARQRELELAKPIDAAPTKGEKGEEITPQVFGPGVPELELIAGQEPEKPNKRRRRRAKKAKAKK